MTATTPFFHRIVETARQLKQHLPVPVIVGGQHVSILQEEAFVDGLDYLFLGECELTFKEFLARFARGEPVGGVPGILARENGRIVRGPEAPRLDNLDEAPLPDRELLPNDLYFVGTPRGRRNYTSVQMTRGCPFRCVYCANDLYGKRIRRRSLDHVLAEVEFIVNRQGIRHIYFIDDTLTLDRKYILGFCDEVLRRGLRFTFEGSTRANCWDEEIATRLKQAGLVRISFGLETAVPEILKLIQKDVRLEAYVAANRINNRLGIETINSVMLGLPGDTRETIRQTVDFLCQARDIHHTTYGIAIPYPGTELYRMALNGLHGLKLVETDFSKYQRYASGVMEVNGLTPADLMELQKEGLRRIYSCRWRILPMIRRHGLLALVPPALDALRSRLAAPFRKRAPKPPLLTAYSRYGRPARYSSSRSPSPVSSSSPFSFSKAARACPAAAAAPA
jgi:anaerobic magnesium-protoporphyrin IX monomethyl ester cyclase